MTTTEAFKHLTDQRGWYKLCKIDPDTARSIKRHFNDDKASQQLIAKLLDAAQYSLIPAKWKAPQIKKSDTK